MKSFIVFVALIAAVASAATKPTMLSGEMSQLQDIVTAIQSPNTDPATAAALQAMLLEMYPIPQDDVSSGPATVEADLGSIATGPLITELPIHDGGALTEVPAASPAFTPIGGAPASSPIVQIILNINNADSSAAPIAVSTPVASPAQAEAVQVTDNVLVAESPVIAPVADAVSVVDQAPGVVVVEGPLSEPISVIEAPVQEEVAVVNPIIGTPAVIAPEILG